VDALPSSIAIRESQDLYSWLLTSHVVSMCAFAGLVLMMDLRLIGIGNMRTPFSQVHRALFPWQVVLMTCSAITGLLLVYAEPLRFYSSFLFWIKVVLMVMASINALAFHRGTYLTVAKWDMDSMLPFGARLAGAVGLTLWAAVVVAGRLIAYNWFTTP
jgi:cytochrome b subunit of formate dehydrogenase